MFLIPLAARSGTSGPLAPGRNSSRTASSGTGAGSRQAGGASRDDDQSLAADLEHFGAIAGAVAIRGQARAEVSVPLIGGAVHLPGLGRLAVGPSAGHAASGHAA